MKKDEYARIIDFLPMGKSEVPPHKRKPIAQVVGEKYYSLLEIVPRKDIKLEAGDRIYIGEGVREEVDHIERRIKYEWLTPTAKTELKIISSGGIRTGLEIAKSIVLGAKIAGIAKPFLKKATKGEEALEEYVDNIIQELRVVMFLLGAKNMKELSEVPALILGKTGEWLKLRGLKPEEYANRVKGLSLNT